MADITVNQVPVNVNLECDNCEEDITISYKEFISRYGEPCDWMYQEVKCPHCGYVNTIGSWDFD